MKINQDCLREVMLYIEDNAVLIEDERGTFLFTRITLSQVENALPGYSHGDICYSILLLDEAKYIEANIQFADGGIYSCIISRLTFEGHEFIDKIRDPIRWSGIKKGMSAVKNYSLSVISALAEGMTSAAIQSLISTKP